MRSMSFSSDGSRLAAVADEAAVLIVSCSSVFQLLSVIVADFRWILTVASVFRRQCAGTRPQ